MDLKQSAIKAINRAFSSEGGKLNSLEASNVKDSIVKQIQKSEQSEATASGSAGVFVQPLEGEMKEKWSEKYKKSINCNNPKGFSQRAHCQGRKKKLKENLSEAERTELAKLKELARIHSKDSKGGSEKERIEKMLSKIQSQFKKGTKVEMEHDMGITKAKQIALS